ncbi:hypothetical protein TcWFU_003367 [Taenia crassiceps]|uniref:Uncharacterized protein n=1 Tax=Taenia crassiceps TaxID=6207 RepID=A0ABR4QG26_9CEST
MSSGRPHFGHLDHIQFTQIAFETRQQTLPSSDQLSLPKTFGNHKGTDGFQRLSVFDEKWQECIAWGY